MKGNFQEIPGNICDVVKSKTFRLLVKEIMDYADSSDGNEVPF